MLLTNSVMLKFSPSSVTNSTGSRSMNLNQIICCCPSVVLLRCRHRNVTKIFISTRSQPVPVVPQDRFVALHTSRILAAAWHSIYRPFSLWRLWALSPPWHPSVVPTRRHPSAWRPRCSSVGPCTKPLDPVHPELGVHHMLPPRVRHSSELALRVG